MNIDKYKVAKSLFKYYLIYHLICDLCILGQFVYWYFLASQSTWYHRMIDNPMMLIDLLLTGPISAIGEIICITIRLLSSSIWGNSYAAFIVNSILHFLVYTWFTQIVPYQDENNTNIVLFNKSNQLYPLTFRNRNKIILQKSNSPYNLMK